MALGSQPVRREVLRGPRDHALQPGAYCFTPAESAAKPRAGVSCRFHDLRHTPGTRVLESGRPLSVVATIMGRSPSTTVRMSRRYGYIGQAAQREAVKALDRADFEAVVHQNGNQKPAAEKTVALTQ